MSKPMTRIAFSLLIALALMVAIYSSVQGANSVVQTASARANASFGKSQTSIQEFNTYDDLGEGDCHHDSIINPEDY